MRKYKSKVPKTKTAVEKRIGTLMEKRKTEGLSLGEEVALLQLLYGIEGAKVKPR